MHRKPKSLRSICHKGKALATRLRLKLDKTVELKQVVWEKSPIFKKPVCRVRRRLPVSEVPPRPHAITIHWSMKKRTEQSREINPLLPSGSLTSDQLGAKTSAGGQIRFYNCLFPGTELPCTGKAGFNSEQGQDSGFDCWQWGKGLSTKAKESKAQDQSCRALSVPVEDMMKSK